MDVTFLQYVNRSPSVHLGPNSAARNTPSPAGSSGGTPRPAPPDPRFCPAKQPSHLKLPHKKSFKSYIFGQLSINHSIYSFKCMHDEHQPVIINGMIGGMTVRCRFRSWFLDDLWIRLSPQEDLSLNSYFPGISPRSVQLLILFAVGWIWWFWCWFWAPPYLLEPTGLIGIDVIVESFRINLIFADLR